MARPGFGRALTGAWLLLVAAALSRVCSAEGCSAEGKGAGADGEGSCTGHVAGTRQRLQDALPATLAGIGHAEIVQLLHHARAPASTMAQVRANGISGRELARNAADARRRLNCSTVEHCLGTAWASEPQACMRGHGVHGATAAPHTTDCTAQRGGGETGGGGGLEGKVGAAGEGMQDLRESIALVRAAGRLMHPGLIEYARRHARARRAAPSHSNRFVVWTCGCCAEPCSGFGNRMLGIVSALMLAVLTERAFLIHWPDHACAPLSDYFASHWIDWRMPPDFRALLSPLDQEYIVNWEPLTGFELSDKFRTFNPRQLDAKPVIWVRASHGLFTDLWRNPHVSDLLCLYGFDTVDDTYALLSRFVLSAPTGELSSALADTLSRPDLAGKYVIGLQMRFTEVSRLSIMDVPRFYSAALAIQTRARVAPADSAWFLATDSEAIKEAVLGGPYREKVIFFEGPIRHLDFERTGCDKRNLLKMYLDWWMLREADGLVASGDSTFGVTAHMLRFNQFHTRGSSWEVRAVMNCHVLGSTSQTSTVCLPCRTDEARYSCGAEDICFNGLYGFTLSEHVECQQSLFFNRCGREAEGAEEAGGGMEAVVGVGDEFLYCAEEWEMCECVGTLRYGTLNKFLLINVTQWTECSNSIAGDPASGEEKLCHCRPSSRPPLAPKAPHDRRAPTLCKLNGETNSCKPYEETRGQGGERVGGEGEHGEGEREGEGGRGGGGASGWELGVAEFAELVRRSGNLHLLAPGGSLSLGRGVGGIDGREGEDWVLNEFVVPLGVLLDFQSEQWDGNGANGAGGRGKSEESAAVVVDGRDDALLDLPEAEAEEERPQPRVRILRPSAEANYKPTGDKFERMLVWSVEGVDALTACKTAVYTSWMPRGTYGLDYLVSSENCEWPTQEGPWCYPRSDSGDQTCHAATPETLVCTLELPPSVVYSTSAHVEVAVSCPDLGINLWHSTVL